MIGVVGVDLGKLKRFRREEEKLEFMREIYERGIKTRNVVSYTNSRATRKGRVSYDKQVNNCAVEAASTLLAVRNQQNHPLEGEFT